MKEMENNDFIHTLDAVYNLCSEIKERISSVETTDEEESNEGIILLSDNLQRIQAGRYNEILEKRGAQGEQCGMSADFMKLIFEAIHEESVRQQIEIINK